MDVVSCLKTEFESRCRRNPNYSIRAFARSLRIDSSTLSAILRGKRPLSAKTARRLLDELPVDAATKKILLLSAFDETSKITARDTKTKLDETTLAVISGWEHYAVLSFLEISRGDRSLRGISKALGLSTGAALSALNRLHSLGLVLPDGSKWKATGQEFTTSSDVPSAALKKAHRDYLERALYSLEHHTVHERDFSGMTMAIASDRIPEAKRLIRDFRRNLASLLETGERNAVYRLNVQLFPLKK